MNNFFFFQESGGDPRKKAELVRTVKAILDEIGLDESLAVIRVLGTILNYIIRRILSGMYVNETKLEQVRMKRCYLTHILELI